MRLHLSIQKNLIEWIEQLQGIEGLYDHQKHDYSIQRRADVAADPIGLSTRRVTWDYDAQRVDKCHIDRCHRVARFSAWLVSQWLVTRLVMPTDLLIFFSIFCSSLIPIR